MKVIQHKKDGCTHHEYITDIADIRRASANLRRITKGA